jgi:CCR4-NOT transcription complex subunit 1
LHDHPDFLSEYYFSLADAIPVHAVQLRNIVLAAFPPEAHLTEPDDAQTAAEDSKSIPIILSDYAAPIRQVDLVQVVDQLLTNPAQPALLSLVMERIANRPVTPLHASDSHYHTSLLNSIVLYIGVQTISQNRAKGEADFNASDAGVAIFEQLAKELEPEGMITFH